MTFELQRDRHAPHGSLRAAPGFVRCAATGAGSEIDLHLQFSGEKG